jgi:CheY-like chemotaxis protein
MQKILVIDDEEPLRKLIRMALQKKGFEILEADNGDGGIALAKTHLPNLILCDVRMAKTDGYMTLNALRKDPETAAIPFILMTGRPDSAGMRQGMIQGADDICRTLLPCRSSSRRWMHDFGNTKQCGNKSNKNWLI